MSDKFEAISRGIVNAFADPSDRLQHLLTKRREKKVERTDFMRGIERYALDRCHCIDASPGDLERIFVLALEQLSFMCKEVGSNLDPDQSRLLLESVRLYNALFEDLEATRRILPILRLGTMNGLVDWCNTMITGFAVPNRPLDAKTARDMWYLCELARHLPFYVQEKCLENDGGKLWYSDNNHMREWFEFRFKDLPERLEDVLKLQEPDYGNRVEKLFNSRSENDQHLLMQAMGGVVSLEYMCRYISLYPTEHVLSMLTDELIMGSGPLLTWLDFGHVNTLATLYAHADRIGCTKAFRDAGHRVIRRPKLVWVRREDPVS